MRRNISFGCISSRLSFAPFFFLSWDSCVWHYLCCITATIFIIRTFSILRLLIGASVQQLLHDLCIRCPHECRLSSNTQIVSARLPRPATPYSPHATLPGCPPSPRCCSFRLPIGNHARWQACHRPSGRPPPLSLSFPIRPAPQFSSVTMHRAPTLAIAPSSLRCRIFFRCALDYCPKNSLSTIIFCFFWFFPVVRHLYRWCFMFWISAFFCFSFMGD